MIRIALMDDHPLMLRILRQELTRETDMRILWETSDAAQLTQYINRRAPDVLVLDLGYTGQAFEPVSAVRDLRARFPDTRILILTGYDDPVWIDELVRAGAQGYVVKSDDFSLRIADAIRTVAGGRTFLSPTAAAGLAHSRQQLTLTARERAILRLAADGKSNPEISEMLGIAHGTVRNHISNIYAKLGVETREGAVRAAQQLRELPTPGATIKHELRTPLHAVIGLARLLHTRLEKNGGLNAADGEFLAQLILEAERLDGLIEGLNG
jgi:DNA-binding NarL/FixJ family response regulator